MRYRLLAVIILTLWGPSAFAEENILTDLEKNNGWTLLFDGRSTHGWMSPKQKALPDSHVQNGSLNPHPCDYMLVYEKPLENFVLAMDFKITEKCNSGIFVCTMPLEPMTGKDVGFNGIEIAIDATPGPGFHTTGAIYDLVPTNMDAMLTPGQWNHIQITNNNGLIQVEVNGRLVSKMDLDLWTEVNKRPDGSAHKFDIAYKNHPRKGYIGLQDHGSDCWYRNIKLKKLP